jgi:putative Ig domain-containing protein
VRSDVVKGRGFAAVAIAAALLLLAGCARPQGIKTITVLPSPTPAAHHDPLIISNPVFHSGEVGVTYAPVTLSAAGGLPPYTWASIGSLPAGLTLSSDGVVSGTPTQSGYFAFGVQVLDFGKNDTAGLPANIPIVSRLTASLVSGCATECTVELGCVTVCGSFGQTSGGAAPLTYKLTTGLLPAGTTLNGLSLNGTFTGLPGRLQFTIQVTDGFGATATIAPTYNLLPHISVASGTCYGNYGIGCSTQLQVTGGSGAASVSLVSEAQNPNANPLPYQGRCWNPATTTPPAGYGLSASPSYVTVSVPARIINGYGAIWTLVAADHNLCGANTYCSSPPATVRIGVQCG